MFLRLFFKKENLLKEYFCRVILMWLNFILFSTELPEGIGYCDKENIYLDVTTAGLFQYWVLYVGNALLNDITAHTNGYFITKNDTHLLLQVPLFAPGIIYEVYITSGGTWLALLIQ